MGQGELVLLVPRRWTIGAEGTHPPSNLSGTSATALRRRVRRRRRGLMPQLDEPARRRLEQEWRAVEVGAGLTLTPTLTLTLTPTPTPTPIYVQRCDDQPAADPACCLDCPVDPAPAEHRDLFRVTGWSVLKGSGVALVVVGLLVSTEGRRSANNARLTMLESSLQPPHRDHRLPPQLDQLRVRTVVVVR